MAFHGIIEKRWKVGSSSKASSPGKAFLTTDADRQAPVIEAVVLNSTIAKTIGVKGSPISSGKSLRDDPAADGMAIWLEKRCQLVRLGADEVMRSGRFPEC